MKGFDEGYGLNDKLSRKDKTKCKRNLITQNKMF